jgi:peptidoglycan glycosyltransferase
VNRQLRRLGIGLLACYVALFAMTNYVQVIRAKSLDNDPRNTRAIVRDFDHDRGQIVSADGEVLACTVPVTTDAATGQVANPADGSAPTLDCTKPALKVGQFGFQRLYPDRDLFGPITGYFNFNFGATGIERTYNDELAGKTSEESLHSLSDLFVDRNHTGDVKLTIRADLQQVARDALGQQQGSVVALDPRDGSILAMWSYPSFDPNQLSTHDKSASDAKTFLEAADGHPLRARTFQERFFPGSTFKVVTGSVGVDAGLVTPDQPSYPQLSSLDLPQTTKNLSNFGGEVCGGTLFDILAISCNTAFAQMGLDIGPEKMIAGAKGFGFDSRPPIDLPAAVASLFPEDLNAHNLPVLAQSAIGQNSVQATPLQMALVAGGIANNGIIMKPHLLETVTDDQGDVVRTYQPTLWKQPVSAQTASVMRQAMLGVVQHGTATRLKIDGVEVAGKTGTAQVNPTDPNAGVEAWIVAFAGPPGGAPTVAVCVLVEAQQGFSEATGGRVAAPIAKQVIQAVLAAQAGG